MKIQYEESGTVSVTLDNGNHTSGIQAFHSEWEQFDLDNATIEPYVAPVKTWEEKRNEERGSIVSQWAYFIDNGYDALKAKDDAIKVKHPKR